MIKSVRNIFFTFVFSIFHYISVSQNLCPNPGFEQITACPGGQGDINRASPWTSAGNASDLFHNCHVNGPTPGCNDVSVPVNFGGFSPAHTGSSYAGFYTKMTGANQRTYLQVPLLSSLLSNKLYKISGNFRCATLSGMASNRIGITFSTSALSQTGGNFIAVTPQFESSAILSDTTGWTNYTFFYAAVGGEAYLTIGNFRNDAGTSLMAQGPGNASCSSLNSSAYYYADDFSVTQITESLSYTGDTLICLGESTTLTGISNTTGYWSEASSPTDTLQQGNNVISVSPTISQTYLWHGVQSSISVTVLVGAAPILTLPQDTTTCDNFSVVLNATNPGSVYQWSTGATTPQIIAADSGLYVVTVNNGYCSKRDSFYLSFYPDPDIMLPEEAGICPANNEFITLDAGPGETYEWLPNGETDQEITVMQSGIYSVTVTHDSGCTKTGFTEVKETCIGTLFVPGSFTPNSDGRNDYFFAQGSNLEEFSMIIFNRWGQPIFETNVLGESGGWNGTFQNQPAPPGVYGYRINFAGNTPEGRKKRNVKAGWLVLLR